MTTPKEPEGAEPMARLCFHTMPYFAAGKCVLCLSSQVAALEKLLRSAEDIVKDTNDLVAMLEKSLGLPPNSHNVINTVRAMVAQVAALEKERDAARDDNARLRAELADAEQQLGVLRPGGRYAWKTKAEAAEAQRDAAREALLRISNCYAFNSSLGVRIYSKQGNEVAVEIAEKAIAPSSSAAKCPCGGDIIQGQNQRTCSRCAWWEPSSSAAKPETR